MAEEFYSIYVISDDIRGRPEGKLYFMSLDAKDVPAKLFLALKYYGRVEVVKHD
jgi:hypothetical protein